MQFPGLSDENLKELLRRPIVAKLATLAPNGDIRMTPLWFGYQDDGSFLINTFESSAHVSNIKRNPKCSLMIDYDEAQPYYGVHYWGTATIEGPEDDADAMGRLFAPYRKDVADATEYARLLISFGKRVFVRFRPQRSKSWDFRG